MPGQWAAALQAHTVDLSGSQRFLPNTVAKAFVIGQVEPAPRSLQAIDITNGSRTKIADLDPKAAGTGWMSADLPWVVWEQGDSQVNFGDWSVHAWNQTTGVETLLATSRLSGDSFVNGGTPFPVVRHGLAFWTQPVGQSQPPQAELRMVDLATGRSSVLDSGTITSPVFAGSSLVWAEVDGHRNFHFKAVDPDTRQPVGLPEGLRNLGTSIGYLAGSPDYLVWSQANLGNNDLAFWKVGSGQYSHTKLDANHPVQFLQIAGHFLVWFAATRSVVFDLASGYGFDIDLRAGAVAASADGIVLSSPSPKRLSWIPATSAPGITDCHS